jgi:hypothetical protein
MQHHKYEITNRRPPFSLVFISHSMLLVALLYKDWKSFCTSFSAHSDSVFGALGNNGFLQQVEVLEEEDKWFAYQGG